MNYIKVIFSNIDGTLLDSSHNIPGGTKECVQKCVESGIPFVLISSRPPEDMATLQNALGIQTPMICYDGALIMDTMRKPVWSIGLTRDIACELEEYVRYLDRSIATGVFSFSDWIVRDDRNSWVEEEKTRIRMDAQCGTLINMMPKDRVIHKMQFLGEEEALNLLERALMTEYSWLRVRRLRNNQIMVTHGKATERNAIHYICHHYGIGPEDGLAFGGSLYDLEMLEMMGASVAMGNAPKEVRHRATYVTRDNDHRGVVHFLNNIA